MKKLRIPRAPRVSEHAEQCAVIEWCFLARGRYPELSMIFAIPNGGKRNIVTATKLKREGVKPGVPDLFLAVPMGGFYGLFIEMKAHGNKQSPQQAEWQKSLIWQGYESLVCWGAGQAIEAIECYLRGKM